MPDLDRRQFITASAAAGLGISLAAASGRGLTTPAPEVPFKAPPLERVRMGFIGVGNQGTSHVKNFLRIDGVEIRAVCDIVPERAANAQNLAVKAGRPKPDTYTKGDHDYKNLCARDDLDLVFIATPWDWHLPMCVDAMNAGKHAAVEVPAVITIDGCWELVETAEKTRRHCVMMENMNYGRFEMMMINMARRGTLGDLLHAECGYLHDLRAMKITRQGAWRRESETRHNGNLYPTHGLGPMAVAMDINCGDAFDYMVSMSSNARGMALFAAEHLPPGDPIREMKFIKGDVNISLIRTKMGRTITLSHDTDNPRPYSRIDLLQGTKGIVQGYPKPAVCIEGLGKTRDAWEDAELYYPEFEDPLWKARGGSAATAGHGGADYLEDFRLIECLLKGQPTDYDVYDAAANSVVCELSELSVAGRKPVDFPDFTRGRWKTNKRRPLIEG